MAGTMLWLGLLGWFMVAKTARDNTAKAEAKEAYLEAQIRRATAYHRAYASAIDEATRERATTEARLSTEFQDAREDEERASRVFYVASQAAKGDTE